MRSVGIVLFMAAALTGCASVTSAQPGSTAVTGEAWYAKSKSFMGLPLGTDIYYCAKSSPTTCKKAEMRDSGEGPLAGVPTNIDDVTDEDDEE